VVFTVILSIVSRICAVSGARKRQKLQDKIRLKRAPWGKINGFSSWRYRGFL